MRLSLSLGVAELQDFNLGRFRAALKAVHPANPTTSDDPSATLGNALFSDHFRDHVWVRMYLSARGVLCFRDASRAPVAVEIESLEVYLSQAPCSCCIRIRLVRSVALLEVQASNESPAVDLQRSAWPEVPAFCKR